MQPVATTPIIVYLGLGSNLGDRLANLRGALAQLARGVELQQCSSVYETGAWGFDDQPAYLNLVCRARTILSPVDLLALVKATELTLGRFPTTIRYGPRPIDVDILLYGDETMLTLELAIPHPRIQDRAFVLIPFSEIAPDVVHPVLDKTIAALRADMTDMLPVKLWGPPLET